VFGGSVYLCVQNNIHIILLPLRKFRWFSSIWLTWWTQTWLTPGLIEWRVYLSRFPLEDLEVSVNLQGSSVFSSKPNQLTCRVKRKEEWCNVLMANNLVNMGTCNTCMVLFCQWWEALTAVLGDFIKLHLPWCCSWRGSQGKRSLSFCLWARWRWRSAQKGRLSSLSSWTEVLHLGLTPWRCLGGAICPEPQFYPEERVRSERKQIRRQGQWRTWGSFTFFLNL